MSRTAHHRGQKHRHNGHDYGAKFKCNKMYGLHYGKHGRGLAHSEMRNESKEIIKKELYENPLAN